MAGDDVVGHLGMLAVDPGRQGDGTGRALLAAASRHAAQELDARVLEMTVIAQRAELIAWYERQGWERTGERRPFPYGDDRFGRPRRDDLEFVVLAKEAAEV
jgi:ribosomal protein S18 acetylase RimI-like enzyme